MFPCEMNPGFTINHVFPKISNCPSHAAIIAPAGILPSFLGNRLSAAKETRILHRGKIPRRHHCNLRVYRVTVI